jgi:hypothetical protein
MCAYVNDIQAVVKVFFNENKPFTALTVRDYVRKRVGSDVDVRYLDVKHELLSYFEKHAPKGWKAVPTTVKVKQRVVASSSGVGVDEERETEQRVWTFAPPKWRQTKTGKSGRRPAKSGLRATPEPRSGEGRTRG